MAIIAQSIVENGAAVNVVLVDEDNLPELPEGQTYGDPTEFPFNPAPPPEDD